MKPSQATTESPALEADHHLTERVKTFLHHVTDTLHHPHEQATHHEPTVVEIVDRVTTMHRGESCDVELDPHITRIENLEKLLPICVEQFGRTIAMHDHPEGKNVILTITVVDEKNHT